MSSPAGLYSQADFLARWMPSSTRAGVILNPSPDLAGSLRAVSASGAPPPQPDDSFTSDFAPLPASADSSCLDVDGPGRPLGGGLAGTDRPESGLNPAAERGSDGQLDILNEMTSKTQELPLTMKLEQLRRWQQHMHEQLKGHQLEELLRLQEEHLRLLGIMNESQICTKESSKSSGTQWGEETIHHHADVNCSEITQTTCGLQQEKQLLAAGRQNQLSKHQDYHDDDEEEEDMWDSTVDDQEEETEARDFLRQPEGAVRSENDINTQDEVFSDRPIRPGIGGQKQTFEELLEEQLRLEEQRLRFAQHQQKSDRSDALEAPPKRPFLKRGEGLSRFTNKASSLKVETRKDKVQPQGRVISRSNSAPAFMQKGSSNSVPQPPVQRKTAVLNKENRQRGLCLPPHSVKAESKEARTKVLGSHQRQNSALESIQTEAEDGQAKHQMEQVKEQKEKVGVSFQALKNCSPNVQQNPGTKQVGFLGRPRNAGSNVAKEMSTASKVEGTQVRTGPEGRGGPPLDSLELSFQEKLQRWECDRQMESMELGEFELLEQAAEELSFSSNSSFVMKVLQMDQQKRQAAVGLHTRRLSSTPIKSPPRGEALKRSGDPRGDVSVCGSMSVRRTRSDVLEEKVSADDEEGQGSQEEGKHEISDISSGCGSEFGDKDVVVKGAAVFPTTSDPPYDKRSYQDEDSFRDLASDVAHEEDEQSDGVLDDAEDSTLIEDRGSHQGRVVFDDDDTWNDLDDTVAGKGSECREFSPVSKTTVAEALPPERTLLRKMARSKAVESDEVPEPNPPPASQLMTRLFPSLKPKAQNAPLPCPSASSEKPKDDTAQQVQSRQLRERLVELEIEIDRFKKENAALNRLRQENEKKQEDLRKERLEFEQRAAEELARFEEYKKEENRKLQKERKLFEKHAAAARAIPDKKEREEIQWLKQQLSSLQEEVRRKESRWASTHGRLRQQIDSLNQENGALRDEIRMLEKLRLSAWKKSSVSEKDIETKEGRRISENNAPSVTKGVTFASPLDSRGSSYSPPRSSAAAATRSVSKDVCQGAAAGIKSSLRWSAGSGSSSSSSSLCGRRTEEKPGACQNQENPPNEDRSQNCSPKTDPKQAESCEVEVITHPDGKVEKVLASGDRLIVFPNGTRKEISADGLSAKVTFFNGDTKQITADQRVIYCYAEAQTTHITYPDGMEVLHFPNNQTEKHFPDGRKEITFPDQTVKTLFPDGREESVLTDGTVIQVNPDGTKQIHFNTGQKEVHTADYKRREYPDGTVKTVYTDGRQETYYPTGRIRVKDKDGNVILDNRT
ncbi:centromere protein J isoform X2 [Kryptolebias marmoratus]|uniref:centromere protein J isoform X2 n=1 Tax=Kryptolebias marmoratus TaxID=37003 RepID=UPI0007F89F21|nr:centromere protein J isoform X2 [Kryptolebias marmoratus]